MEESERYRFLGLHMKLIFCKVSAEHIHRALARVRGALFAELESLATGSLFSSSIAVLDAQFLLFHVSYFFEKAVCISGGKAALACLGSACAAC